MSSLSSPPIIIVILTIQLKKLNINNQNMDTKFLSVSNINYKHSIATILNNNKNTIILIPTPIQII